METARHHIRIYHVILIGLGQELNLHLLLQCNSWEKLNRGVSKPGGFLLFSGKVQIVSQTLSGLFLVGAVNRPRKRKRANQKNPRRVPGQIGKIPENQESPKKDKKGRTSPDRENPPRLKPPRLAALEILNLPEKIKLVFHHLC